MSSPGPPYPPTPGAVIPLVMSGSGPVPTPPATLLVQLIALVSTTNPGYTANLPFTLIEDIASTDVGALTLLDQLRVALIQSLTPYGANAYLANALGSVYGVPVGIGSNTSVQVQFYDSTPGFPIIPGFTVSDGTNQYIIQDGGIVSADRTSGLLSAIATQQGSWPVPPNTVINLVTQPPDTAITLNVTNPIAGLPGASGQLVSDYQAQVLQAGLAASTGMSRYMKTLLENVPGVQPRLISVQTTTLPAGCPGWTVIVGGGDNYQVANAIFESLFDISTITGSVIDITDISNDADAIVTTLNNHNLAGGSPGGSGVIEIVGVVMSGFPDGTSFDFTVISEKEFSIGVSGSGWGSYISGGIVLPNPINVNVTIYDYPDQYEIPFVSPPQQVVSIAVTWNTTLPNFTGSAAIQQLAPPALVNYVNSVAVGQPINLFELQNAFQEAVVPVLSPANLTRMVFSVSINGVPTTPEAGTGIIASDPFSYFFTSVQMMTVTRG